MKYTVTIDTPDLAAGIAFYGRVFGLVETARPVPVYAVLSGSRLVGVNEPERKGEIQIWRAEAMNAWRAGVNGIYTFNRFRPDAAIFRELGNPETIGPFDPAQAPKPGEAIEHWLKGGKQFLRSGR